MVEWSVFTQLLKLGEVVQSWRQGRRKHDYLQQKKAVLRYFFHHQSVATGIFAPQLEDVVAAFPDIPPEALGDILLELVTDRSLVFRNRWYYLAGHEPTW